MSTTIYLAASMAIEDSTMNLGDTRDADLMVCWECTKAFHGRSIAAMASARIVAFCDNTLGHDLAESSIY